LINQLHVRPGQDIDVRRLGGDLDWLNRNPFRQVDLVMVKGAQPGETDLLLRQTERFPVNLYVGGEDSGTPVTGNNRVLAGATWGNAFFLDGQVNYQYMADPAFKWFRGHSGSLIQPLPWRNLLTLSGSYADVHGNMAPPFALSGFSQQASLRYEIPLPKLGSSKLSLRQSLVAGFDFKRANTNLVFGGTQVFGAMTDTLQWVFGYDFSLKDPWGDTMLRTRLFHSPGRWTANDTDGFYAQSRSGATARYTYANIDADRTTGLPYGFVLINRGVFQWSDSNLLAGEQLGFGGYDTDRKSVV
jgi:hemolysin activation/secretion protein